MTRGSTRRSATRKLFIYQCCLERDLELWDAGDKNEIGEKGLTLSGGQKARVTLARAIYADAQFILLGDVLSALDVHTAKWIVDKCFSGDLVKDRTILLVTHNVSLTGSIAQFVVSVGLDGRVRRQDSISEALTKDTMLVEEMRKDNEILRIAEKAMDAPSPAAPKKTQGNGKLIVAEEVAIGRVSWRALNLYFRGLGGNHTLFFFALFIIGLILAQLSDASRTWFLGYWESQYGNGVHVAVFYYLGIFCGLMGGGLGIYALSFILYNLRAFRASMYLHAQLIQSILRATFRWLDVTPTSRIVARCTADIGAVDAPIALGLWSLLELSISMLVKLSAVILLTPVFFFPGAFVGILGGWFSQVYLASQHSVKRELSAATAPVIGHFGTTVAGLTSIRAYGAQNTVIKKSFDRINRLSRVTRINANLNCWIIVRIDTLGGIFVSLHLLRPAECSQTISAASLAYYFQGQRPENIGFSLNMALGFSNTILNWVRTLNEFEIQGKRIQRYMEIEHEPEPIAAGIPPAYWPASGSIHVDKLSAKYSPEGPKVLHNISFDIKSGERVGVVGRTGSGKSSLTLSLLRCIFTEGVVYYDGIPASLLNLDALRANITIIPQVLELLSGSLRSNLDIIGQFNDVMLNSALRAAGLSSLQNEMAEGKLTLDSVVSSGGANLSVGTRQIIALARAIVLRRKLLILDEGWWLFHVGGSPFAHRLAQYFVDYKIDAIIQTSLRTELHKDTTCIIVVHRIQSVMDVDKIMVLDAGRIASNTLKFFIGWLNVTWVEFGLPKILLENKDGMLRALVDDSGEREVLYKMAQV
ncbi:ATP-binding cassette transporter abc4 [Mycena venus]|uniref:ATP-binding cassette transporter abc4 n=1 Tax=Mycena venus TaxID=2733690 RepID=A0A8H6YU85_9AGAR|nr:ATP-binding cassette transporter abc4 [Mycena venus]